jgi:pyruvate dehydrogenase E2 component (dihydrolipoamide acetyltransferase)
MSRIKEFTLPDLGEGLTEGEILKWLVAVGDTVELNQPIVEVETAKAAVEIPAKWAGQVQRIFHQEGAMVEVGSPIIAIDTDPGAAPDADAEPAEGLIGGAAPGGRTAVLVGYGPRTTSAKRRQRKSVDGTPAAPTGRPQPDTAPSSGAPVPVRPMPGGPSAPATSPVGTVTAAPITRPAPVATPAAARSGVAVGASATGQGGSTVARGDGLVLAKPPVRKLARDLGVELGAVTGSGPLGSITRADVQQAAAGAVSAPEPAGVFDATVREQRVPVKGIRKLTADNMVASAFTAPHVTEFLTVDVTRSMKALDRLRAQPDWRDVRVSPLLLVAKAVLLGVERYPMINSSWSGETNEIVVKRYVNLGIAAATERGLIVPNIKDAGRLPLKELADALTGLVQTAKAGRCAPADMSGGTFTITNVGVFGVDTGTPILPPGEAAILAFGAVRKLPWVHKGKIKLRQVTTLALSFDHRVIDGELGSKFLRDVGAFLADPEAALLAWG